MGSIRTPKPSYFDGGVIEFFVKNKEIHYKTIIWTKDGTKQFTFETGRFDYKLNQDDTGRTLHDIINRALQSFSNGGLK